MANNDFKRGIRVYLETSDYGKGIDEMVAKTKKLEDRYSELTAESEKMTAAGIKSGKEWNQNHKELAKVEKQIQANKSAEADYRSKLEQTTKTLKNLSGATYNELSTVRNQMRKELQQATRGTEEHTAKLKAYQAVSKEVALAQREMNVEVGCQGTIFGRAANAVNKYFALISAGIAAITGITMVISGFRQSLMELEDSKANLKALTGLKDEDIDWLAKYAKKLSTSATELGIRIKASSKEIMDGFTVVGSKRPELLKNKEAMAEVTKQALTLAQTSKMEVAVAFDVVTAAMNQFNLEAKDSGRIINTIAAGSLEGSAEADNLAGSLKNVGTVANDSNMSLEQTVATLEVLASKQLVGEEAGTKLRGALLKMKEAGVGYVSGAFNMRDAIDEINKKMAEKATAAERDALLIKVFGAENVTAGTILLKNVDAYDKLTKAVTGTNVAVKQAQINSMTTSARMAQAKNEINEMGMKLVQTLNPAMLTGTKILTAFMRLLIDQPAIIYTLLAAIGVLTAAYVASTAAKMKNIIVDKISITLATAERIAVLALAAAKALLTGNIIRARAAMSLLNKEMMINPYVAVIAIIAALTYGIYKLVTAQTIAQKAWADYNIQVETEVRNSELLFDALKRSGEGTAERKRLIDKINSVYGEYLTNQLTEKSTLQDIALAQMDVNRGIREKIGLQMKEKAISDIIQKYTTDQIDSLESVRKAVAKSLGKNMADIVMDEIKSIYDSNPIDKAGDLALDRLRNYLGTGKNELAFASVKSDVNSYTNSVREMNKELANTEKSFGFIKGKSPMTMFMPNDHPKNEATPTKVNSIDSLKAEIDALNKELTAATIGSKKFYQLKKEIAEKQKQLDAAEGKNPKSDKAEQERKKQLQKKLDALDAEKLAVQSKMKQLKLEGKYDEQDYTADLLDVELEFLRNKRDLYKKDSKEYQELDGQVKDILLNKQKTANEATLKSIEDSHAAIEIATTKYEQTERDRFQQRLDEGLDTQNVYNQNIIDLDIEVAKARLKNATEYSEIIGDATFNSQSDKEKAVKAANEAVTAANAVLLKAKAKSSKDLLGEERTRLEEIARMRQNLGLDQEKLGYLKSLSALKAHLKKVRATEKESAELIAAFKKKKAVEYAEIAVDITNRIASAMQTYQQVETSNLETEKNKQLTLNENNLKNKIISEEDYQTKKDAINNDFAQKELDLRKKQANANVAIQVAQAIAAGALGVMNIWASPGMNPVLAGILTAAMIVTTGLEVSSIIAQNAAIQATTLDSSSSSGSPAKVSTGARVATAPQAAEGRWTVLGDEDRKLYRNVPYAGVARTGMVTTPTLMGEAGDELVVDNPTLRNIHMNAPWVLDVILNNRVPQRASGNYKAIEGGSSAASNSSAELAIQNNTALLQSNLEAINQMIALLAFLRDNGIDAFVLLSQLEKQQMLRDKSLNKGSLK